MFSIRFISDFESVALVEEGDVAIVKESNVVVYFALIAVLNKQTPHARWFSCITVNFTLIECSECLVPVAAACSVQEVLCASVRHSVRKRHATGYASIFEYPVVVI